MPTFNLQYAVENWGWLVAVILVLVLNGDKVAARFGTFIPPLANWLEKRRVEKEVVTSAKLAAKLEQDDAVLHHEFDAEAASQAYAMRQQSELLAILKDTLSHFWEDRKNRETQWERVYTALLRLESTLSLHTMTIARQADAYGDLACVQAARQTRRDRAGNGDKEK